MTISMHRIVAAVALALVVGCIDPAESPDPVVPGVGATPFASGGIMALTGEGAWAVSRVFVNSTDWQKTARGYELDFTLESPDLASGVTGVYSIKGDSIEPFLVEPELGLHFAGVREEPIFMDLLVVVAVASNERVGGVELVPNGKRATSPPNISVASGSGARVAFLVEFGGSDRRSEGFQLADSRMSPLAPTVRGAGTLSATSAWSGNAPASRFIDLYASFGAGGGFMEIDLSGQPGTSSETREFGIGSGPGRATAIDETGNTSERFEFRFDAPSSDAAIQLTDVTIPWSIRTLGLEPAPLSVRGGTT